MLNALSQSPITANQFFEWDKKLQNDEILVREIIDIDTNYMDDDDNSNSPKQKKQDDDQSSDENNNNEDDEFNPTLAAMESEIKPKFYKQFTIFLKNTTNLLNIIKKN